MEIFLPSTLQLQVKEKGKYRIILVVFIFQIIFSNFSFSVNQF